MTTVENHHAHVPPAADYYDPDDVGCNNSPQMNAVKVNLQPSSTPSYMVPLPPVDSPVSSSGSPGRKGSKPFRATASQSDAGLVSMMGNGKNIDIARQAGAEVLAAENEMENEVEEPTKNGGIAVDMHMVDDISEVDTVERETESEKDVSEKGEEENSDLALVAAKACEMMGSISLPQNPDELKNEKSPTGVPPVEKETIERTRPEERRPTIPSIFVANPNPRGSPEGVIGLDRRPSVTEALPPIRHHSPSLALSNGNAGLVVKPTLPSISDSLKSIAHESLPPVEPTFAQSPPARQPPLFSAVSSHGSPPKSPNDFRRELPSPGRAAFYPYNSHRRTSQAQSDGIQYSSAGDYSSSNTETPSTDASGATPAIDRMSIDGITNPQIGGFQCTYPGCNAQPFQTQVIIFRIDLCSKLTEI